MFEKLTAIKRVNKGFYISNSQIIYQSDKEVYEYDLIESKELFRVKVSDDFQGLVKKESFIIGISGLGYALFDLELNPQKATAIENGIGDYNLYNESLVVITTDYDYSLFQPKQGVQNVESDTIIWEAGTGESIRIAQNKVFTVSPKEVGKRDFSSGESEWLYGIENENFVPDLIGYFQSLVFFGLQKRDKIIALDLATGKLKWDRTTLPTYYKLDKIQNRLLILTGAYKCLDPLSGNAIDSFDDQSYFNEVGIFSQRNNYAIDGDHLITTDYQKGIIGAFNTVTHRFDWLHEEEGVSFPAPSPVIYQAPYLMVHDNLGTLHVFNRS